VHHFRLSSHQQRLSTVSYLNSANEKHVIYGFTVMRFGSADWLSMGYTRGLLFTCTRLLFYDLSTNTPHVSTTVASSTKCVFTKFIPRNIREGTITRRPQLLVNKNASSSNRSTFFLLKIL